MKKIYCSTCSYYMSEVCTNIINCKTEEIDDWHSKRVSILDYGKPEEINKNNDCKYFEMAGSDFLFM